MNFADYTFDPMSLKRLLWPHIRFYFQQKQVIYSVLDNVETYVPAGNMLGKDFVAGFIALSFFLTRKGPCRIVTTSAKDDHLRVLWGEINSLIQSSVYPLKQEDGGPLLVNHQDIRIRLPNMSENCPISYLTGLVASPNSIAAMQGHHVAKTGDGIPRTLFISDESSSVPDPYHKMASTWFNRALIIGNTWPCDNFFSRAVKEGDIPKPKLERVPVSVEPVTQKIKYEWKKTYYRKVIKITVEDSPNVIVARKEIAQGLEPTNRMVIPGVKPWDEYQMNLQTWDEVQKTVCLFAEFYEGIDVRLFPKEWLALAAKVHSYAHFPVVSSAARQALKRGMGVDPAEGGDSTTWCIGDEIGILDLVSMKTPDTSVIIPTTLTLLKKWKVQPEDTLFDRGGGGKQVADMLRSQGYPVRTIGFGEAITPPLKYRVGLPEKKEVREEKTTYFNKRAEMYGKARLLFDPVARGGEDKVFSLPDTPQYAELRRQLLLIPLLYNSEGVLKMLPKSKPAGSISKEKTLTDIIGHSPDEADAFVLFLHALTGKKIKVGGN